MPDDRNALDVAGAGALSMRFFSSIGASAVIVFLLFLLMSTLISGGRDDANYRQSGIMLDFIRITKNEIIKHKIRQKPDEPEPPKKLQAPPRIDVSKHTDEPPRPIPVELFDIDVSLGGDGGSFAGVWNLSYENYDRDAVSSVRIIPLYPREALIGGVEGWVELEFTVTETGAVADAVVIASHPNRVFDRAALRAVYRWKYKPRIVDGVATSQLKRQEIVFHIESTE